MKRKHRRTLERLAQAEGSVEIRRVEALIRALGGEIEDRGNGLYRAELNEVWLVYDRPHPSPEIGRGFAKRVRTFLQNAGVLPVDPTADQVDR